MTTPMPTRIAGFADLLTFLDDLTGGWFGPIVLLGIFGTLLFSFRGKSAAVNFANSALITLIAAVLLNVLGVLDWIFIIACFGLALISFAVQRLQNPDV